MIYLSGKPGFKGNFVFILKGASWPVPFPAYGFGNLVVM